MNSLPLPRLRLLRESQLGSDTCHSVLIALLRGMAALQVAAAHLRADFFPGLREAANPAPWYQALAFFTGFAHQAVVVFFLISGWLVGGSLLNKLGRPDAIKLYAIDRVTRLWTVLLPTFMLILALGIVTGKLDPRSADFSRDNPYSVTAFVGNMAGLQTISVPQFGGNFPLWSLANESWYYLLFPLLALTLGAGGPGRRLLPAAALAAAVLLLPFGITLYFSIWLLGAAFSRVRLECGAATRAALLALLAGMSVYFRLVGANDDMNIESFLPDLLLSVVFLLFLSSTVATPLAAAPALARLRPVGDFFSNFSFTLYVVHVPVLGMLAWLGTNLLGRSRLDPARLADLGVYFLMLGLVTIFSYGFYRLFEARTGQVRRWMKGMLFGRALRAAPAAVER